jgi:hypothetical protein
MQMYEKTAVVNGIPSEVLEDEDIEFFGDLLSVR